MAAESTVTQASLPPVDLPFSCMTNVSRRDHHQKRFSGRARKQVSISSYSKKERERQENVLYSVLLKWKALHSMIVQVSDIEMAMTIEGQTDGKIELICTFSHPVSTHHDSALCCPTTPAHHSIIPEVCHVDVACRIDPHSTRMRQLRQILPLASFTSHDNPFFGALHPFHHTMIPFFRHVDSVFSIHTDEGGGRWVDSGQHLVHFHQRRRCHSSLLGDSVSLHPSRRQWHRVIPRHPSPIPNKRCCRWSSLHFGCPFDEASVSLAGYLSRRWRDCRSLCRRSHLSADPTDLVHFLLHCHRPALCHSSHLASILRCGDCRSQQRSPCPRHPRRDPKGWRVGFSHPLVRVLQRQWRLSAPTERWLQRKKESKREWTQYSTKVCPRFKSAISVSKVSV